MKGSKDSSDESQGKKGTAGAKAVESSESDKRARDTSSEIEETAMLGEEDQLQLDSVRPRRLPGDAFGRYRIRKILGEGAMGSVYLALDTQLHRKVALKLPKLNSRDDSKFIARFLREARAAATLSHPNICPVYDVGEIDTTHFIAMAYIQGQPLSEFVDPDKPQRDRGVAVVVRKIALALNEAHSHGLIHRDVKPANIMIDHRNEPIIMDFGLARHVDDDDARLTTEGTIIGSPAYMSPEQIDGQTQEVGPACDIYSLGVIFYELLTGRLPFEGSIASIIAQIVTRQPDDPRKSRPDVSPRLAAICMKAMAKKIEDRYPTMKVFSTELTDFLKSANGKTTGKSSRQKADLKKDSRTSRAEARPRRTSKSIEVTCSCGQQLVAKRALAGKTVKCPRCGELRALPHDSETGTLPQIDVSCVICGQHFKARPELGGRVVKCTSCGQPLAVPKPGDPTDSTTQILAKCGCGQQFLANRELAGRRVKCTSCGLPIDIPPG